VLCKEESKGTIYSYSKEGAMHDYIVIVGPLSHSYVFQKIRTTEFCLSHIWVESLSQYY